MKLGRDINSSMEEGKILFSLSLKKKILRYGDGEEKMNNFSIQTITVLDWEVEANSPYISKTISIVHRVDVRKPLEMSN